MRLFSQLYILKNRVPVREPDLFKWGIWFEKERKNRIVKQQTLKGSKVSTVFLGMDHGWLRRGDPILWETMVFGGKLDQEQDRCSGGWKDALFMHRRMVKRVKEGK